MQRGRWKVGTDNVTREKIERNIEAKRRTRMSGIGERNPTEERKEDLEWEKEKRWSRS